MTCASQKVSRGAMTSGYYTSLHSEKVQKLVLYAPLYSYTRHTNLGAGSGLQDKRNPANFNPAMGAYRLGSGEANQKRWDGEIPVADKTIWMSRGSRIGNPRIWMSFSSRMFRSPTWILGWRSGSSLIAKMPRLVRGTIP